MPKWSLKPKSVLDYAIIVIASIIQATALVVFIQPLRIPMGGVTGIALVLNYLWALPIGVLILLMNIPLFVLSFKFLGRRSVSRTIVNLVTYSLFLDIVGPFIPRVSLDPLLAAICGGAVMGAGVAMVFYGGGTGGGTDIVAKLINRKNSMPIGNINLVINGLVIVLSAVIYRSFESALYALIVQYIMSAVLDKILLGLNLSVSATIITLKPEEISQAIFSHLPHSVTAMKATGMYTGTEKTVLICAFRRSETTLVKRLVAETDPASFMLLSTVTEIYGKGFKSISLQI